MWRLYRSFPHLGNALGGFVMTSIMARHAKPAHKSAARLLGYALTAGDFDTWEAASAVWQARLTAKERAALAYMALRSLDFETVCVTAGAALLEPEQVRPAA